MPGRKGARLQGRTCILPPAFPACGETVTTAAQKDGNMEDRKDGQMLMTMERELTGSQKVGFFFLGFLGGIVGILATSLMNINAPYRHEGTKMAALGFVTALALGALVALMGCVFAVAPYAR